MIKKLQKTRLKNALKGWIFGVFAVMMMAMPMLSVNTPVYAEPEATETTETTEATETGETTDGTEELSPAEAMAADARTNSKTCNQSLGAIGWLVCPTTGKIAEAVDWLYDKIETILVVNPVEMKDGSPIYEVWKYVRGVTNIVFMIFLLVMVYSQITGLGITNYGLKKTLPKLIVGAILVNLSFVICSLAVDLSNVVGSSLRGVFTGIEEATMANMVVSETSHVSMSEMYASLAGGSVLAVGAGAVAFETGAIWMLIPTALGAIVAVVVGLITIALRQAVVALLIMIAPLAVIAYILPNTEQWFTKWKQMLYRMLVFYPAFSLLFGASSLAGFAIIMSARDGFLLLLGIAVQIFPLFFSWKLMSLSGTFLSTIHGKLSAIAARPLASNRAWAESHRELTRQKALASNRAYTPSLRLAQFMSNRSIARSEETSEHSTTVKNRGLAYTAQRNYRHGDVYGSPSKEGEAAYEAQARNARYQQIILRHQNNMNGGFKAGDRMQEARLNKLDQLTIDSFDKLKMEQARGAMIEYENAKGFHKRISDAIDAHMDDEVIRTGAMNRKLHDALTDANIKRYDTMKYIFDGNEVGVHYVAADASHVFNAQAQIVRNKFSDYFDLTVPTQDIVNRLNELTKNPSQKDYIDPIIAGLRTLNMRGDTDLVRQQLSNVLDSKSIELGTYAAQAISSFLMFDVKGNDPFLRRLGKYINLETASMYNDENGKPRRTKRNITMDEYVNSEYIDEDEQGQVIYESDGTPKMRVPKRGATILMKGTSFKDMERTAITDMTETIRKYSVDADGKFDYEKFKRNEFNIWDAIMPNIISDQFSYLSGSEQIIALGKGLTGVDVKDHNFDWKGIFGEEIAEQLTPEQKRDYVDFVSQRIQTFLGGHVPSQIAKTKTDMLEVVRAQYALKDAIDKDPDFFKKAKKDGEPGAKMSKEQYAAFEKEHLDAIKKKFVGSFKEDALKGFVKMHHKGYQGEAKDGLIQLLDPDELYKQYFPNGENGNKDRRKRQFEDEEEDGMPVGGGDEPTYGVRTGASETSQEVEMLMNEYKGTKTADVKDFWSKARKIITSSIELQIDIATLDEIDNMVPQFTSVATFYNDVIRPLFGETE